VAMGLGKGRAADRIITTVADLDDTIRQLRTTIYELHDLPKANPSGLRARLLDVAADATKALGFNPSVRFDGLIDTLSPEVGQDLIAVLREALANVARHAKAGNVVVELVSGPDQLSLTVEDDGVGFAPGARSSGLSNMRRRAERHRGTFDIAPREPAGTTVRWTIPRT
jgi:signal transduction histidine kinase